MAQAHSSEYMTALQAHVAALRRKLLEERAEQERAQRAAERATSKAELLQSELRDSEAEIVEKRRSLVEQSMQAVNDRSVREACKKEVSDRQLQVAYLSEELQKAEQETEERVKMGIPSGREAIEREESACLDYLSSQRTTLREEAEAVQNEVLRLRAQMEEDSREASQHVRRSASVQLCAVGEYSRHRLRKNSEEEKAKAMVTEVEQQAEERRRQRDNQLDDVATELNSFRETRSEQQRKDQAKAEKRKKALVAKIRTARRKIDQLERDVADHEAKFRTRGSEVSSAKCSTEPVDPDSSSPSSSSREYQRSLIRAHLSHDSVLQPMIVANARRSKAGGLHTEFPLVGALQGLEEQLRLAAATSLPRLPPVTSSALR